MNPIYLGLIAKQTLSCHCHSMVEPSMPSIQHLRRAIISMLTFADVCWRMLTHADVCWRMLTYADVGVEEGSCASLDASSSERLHLYDSILLLRLHLAAFVIAKVLQCHRQSKTPAKSPSVDKTGCPPPTKKKKTKRKIKYVLNK